MSRLEINSLSITQNTDPNKIQTIINQVTSINTTFLIQNEDQSISNELKKIVPKAILHIKDDKLNYNFDFSLSKIFIFDIF